MRFSYIFRADFSQKIGLGHLKRLLILKKKLKINPIWIVNGNNQIFERFEKKSKVIYVKNIYEEKKLISNLKDAGLKKVVLDISNSNNLKNNRYIKIFNIYKKLKFKIISYDLPFAKLNSDISIIPYEFNRSILKKSNIEFKGSDYFINENKKFKINNHRKKIKKILISISGSDYKQIGYEIYKILEKENFNIRVLQGLNKNGFEQNSRNSFLNLNKNIQSHLNWSDLIICGEGLIKYDAIYFNKPIIIIHQFDDKSDLIKTFLNQDMCLSLGIFRKEKKIYYREKILNYINDKLLQELHIKNQQKIFNNKEIKKKQLYLFQKLKLL